MSVTSPTIVEDAAARWTAHFRDQPLAALDGALTGRAHLGAFNTLPPAVALGQLIAHPERTLDPVLLRWLRERWGQVERPGLRPRRYAEALAEALRAVDMLGLSECREWLRQRAPSDYRWLRALQVGGPATPLDALLATLATVQPDRALESFWLRLSRLEGQTPLEHGRTALTGLRLLPAADPSRPAPPTALFGGLIHFAEGLARRGAGPDALHEELRYFCALQSLTPAALGRHLRKALDQRLGDQSRGLNKDARAWLEAAAPTAFKKSTPGSGQVVEQSPMPAETNEVVNRIRREGLDKARGPLNNLIRGHRQYYERTGDGFYLARVFNRLSGTVRGFDPQLARDLAHESLRLEPSDVHGWGALGLALDAAGDWTRARAVFWHARRRFPHNPFAHNQLGQVLLRHGEDAAALLAYAEAVRRFPRNPVAVAGYGHALLELEGPEAARPVLRAGVQTHPDHLPLRSDYTEALIEAGELTEAEQQLETSRRIHARSSGRHDPKLDQLAHRLDLARTGHFQNLSILRQDPALGPAGELAALSDITGSSLVHAPALGESTLFRHAGELARADQAIQQLPASPERDAEQGLWIAGKDGWGVAADWWRARAAYEPVTRIHALRSRQRSGEPLDWPRLTWDLPQYDPIIRSLSGQDLPELSILEEDPEDRKRDAWLYTEIASGTVRRDEAEEDWLAAAQII
ncbi:MAG: hypothetical protein LGR52_01325 [Candidatus Thiosymbion ectosymbiont of Robbea hypermnestra]|nr:hypothetical protein [Candidatus Thiosymbion ectosymbiont of Robbea hypermnestra]